MSNKISLPQDETVTVQVANGTSKSGSGYAHAATFIVSSDSSSAGCDYAITYSESS